jgi:hypothetical protein
MESTKQHGISITLVAVIAALVVYGLFFGVQTSLALEWWFLSRKSPVIKIVPQGLPDQSQTQSPGLKLSHSGYEFEIPWNDVDEEKSKTVGTMRLIAFKSRRALLIYSLPPRNFVDTVLKISKDEKIYRQAFGEDATSSDYKFHKQMLEATPGKINPLGPRRDATREALFLFVKTIALPSSADTGIFSVQTPHFSGFQYGDPRSNPRRIIVYLFDENGGLELSVASSEKFPGSAITQADINRIAQSVRRSVSSSPSSH